MTAIALNERRRQRRRDVAEFVRGGASLAEAADRFGISIWTVYGALREHGVTVPNDRRSRVTAGTLRLVAELLNTADSLPVLAARCGVSRHAAWDVLKRAKQAGIRFPGRDGA